jgi:hypothetical protein
MAPEMTHDHEIVAAAESATRLSPEHGGEPCGTGGETAPRLKPSTVGWARPNWNHKEALDVDVENLLAKVADNLSVRRAFGTAYEKDGMLVIPVAIVAGGGGGGTGHNRRGNPAAGPGSPQGEGAAARGGAPQGPGRAEEGGGFGGLVLPSGAYVVKGDQVRWVPAVDVTIAALASLSLVRMLTWAWARQRKHRRP